MVHNMLTPTWVTIVGFGEQFCSNNCLQFELHALSHALLMKDKSFQDELICKAQDIELINHVIQGEVMLERWLTTCNPPYSDQARPRNSYR